MRHKVKEESVKFRHTIAISVRALFPVLVIMAALFATAQTAEAAGVPTKLIVFTDKKVYTDAYNSPRTTEANTGQVSPGAGFTEDFRMIVYAIILDDEGNILPGNQSINFTARTVDDVKKLDHGPITSTAVHHDTITNNPTILDGQITFPALQDDGTNFDTNANDGIYTALIDLPDYSVGGATKAKNWAVGTSTLLETNAHLLVAVNVTFNNGINPLLNATTSVLFTQYNCHQTAEGDHPNAHVGNDGAATTFEPCNMCHIGYDHLYNYKNFSEFPSDFGDVAHANKLKPPAVLGDIVTANTADIVYNTTYGGNTEPQWQITSWSVFLNQGDTSNYCYVCHFNPGSLPLDYGSGAARTDLSDRPSCSVASKSLRGGTANVNCHATTNITATDIIPWNQSAASTTHMLLDNLTAAKSHNHSTSTANLPCAGCHLTIHSLVLPNKTSDNNINNQCKYCHSDTGPKNSTIMPHGSTTTNCTQCHRNATGVLNAHLVPEGIAGGANCTECHNTGGNGNNVNFTTVGKGMHANLNRNASSSAQNATNKPCWACHGTINATSGLANYSDQPSSEHNKTVYKNPRKCDDCHVTGKLQFNAKNVTDHILSGYTSFTDVNTSSYNFTTCSYCHNNSVNYSNDTNTGLTISGSPLNASVSHYGANKTANKLMSPANNSTDCVYCHRNNSNMLKWGILSGSLANISNKNATGGGTDHTAYTSSSQCASCHGGYTVTAGFTFHNTALGSGSFGGRNCTSCHDVGKSSAMVDVSKMNQTSSIHNYLNTNGTASIADNKRCWGCHTNSSVSSDNRVDESELPAGEHPDGFDTPRNCTLCHIDNKFGALIVSEHFTSGSEIKTKYYSGINSSCAACHNKTEMLLSNNDPGGVKSIYASVSHYGDNKTSNTTYVISSNANCTYCHNNTNAFTSEMTDFSWNSSIRNHTGLATNPNCTDANCHGAGRIHVSTLTKPQVSSTLCLSCHDTKVKHNGTVECVSCHLENNKSIHPVQYLQPDSTWKINSVSNKSSAVKCTDCHQTGVSGFDAPLIPGTLKHSSNISNGTIWGTFWTSELSSCNYCHGNTTHNYSSALGRIYNLTADTNNTRNGAISTTTWCVDCHYNTSNANYKGDLWAPVPPLITVNNTLNGRWEDHSTYLGSGIKDTNCEGCHAQNITAAATSLNYSHSLDEGVAGGPNCIQCHNLATGLSGGAPAGINFTSFNQSTHFGMNSVNSTANGACWACHDSDGNVTSGHGDRQKTPKSCDNCHLVSGTYYTQAQAWGGLRVDEHYYSGSQIKAGNSSSNITSCINCHENISGMILYNNDTDTGSFTGDGIRQNGGNLSAYHYGKNRTDLRSWNGSNTANCTYCHNDTNTPFSTTMTDAAGNTSILNHSTAASPTCYNSTCHSGGWIHNSTLTRPLLPLPNTTYCSTCHSDKNEHNGTQQCTKCHVNTSSSQTIHPIKFVQATGQYNTSSNTAANCTNCHQNSGVTGFNAPIIPAILKHSSNLSNGSLWNNTATPYWTNEEASCYYCHNDTRHNSTALGSINVLLNTGNVRNGQLATTGWCADCHYNATANTDYKGSLWNPAPPLITINNTGKARWDNHSGYFGSGYNDSVCKGCHAQNITASATSLNYSHSLDEGVAGGPNCISCHNLATGLSGGVPAGINYTSFNQSTHFGMNAVNSTANGACWACHDSDGNVTSGHGDRQKTPKICTECHIGTTGTFNNSAYNAIFVWEHYNGGEEITAGNSVSNIASCINCHENVSEMILYNNDTDTGSFTGDGLREKGGNMSFYHYGKPRTDMRVGTGLRESNCLYCHQNTSTAFQNAMQNPAVSKYVYNHTDNPAQKCTTCHVANQWIHNKSLTIPNGGLVDNGYCSSCHTTAIGGVRAIPDTHNSLGVNCWACHQDPNTSANPMYATPIHGMMYALSNGSYLRHSDNNTPADCTTCHVYSLVNTSPNTAAGVPALNHSTDMYAGRKWGNYWDNNSPITACYFCHQSEPHNQNTVLLGNISNIQGSNQYKSSNLAASRWCSACHYNDSTLNYKGSILSPVPPEILNSTGTVPHTANDGTVFYSHSGDVAANSNDSKCIECHALSGIFSETTLNYSHSLNEGGGGPDCVSSGCHGATGSGTSPYMNWTALKTGMHSGLNSGAANTTTLTDPIDKACWACHGDGTQPGGHPANYKQPYNCTACHLASGVITGKYKAKNVTEHQHVDAQVLTNPEYGRCENCHNNSLVSYSDNETSPTTVLTNYTSGNVSHYGANRSAGKLMYNTTGNSEDCVWCHLNNSNRQKWANATNATATKPDIHGSFNASTPGSKCWECHVDNGVSGVTSGFTLHNSSLNPGASEFCLTCHAEGGSASHLNVTETRMGAHITLNNTPSNTLNNSDCWSCHFGYPNGTTGSHSYNVTRENTYYCEDCHGPDKNQTAIDKGIDSQSHIIPSPFQHAELDCGGCHVANDSRKPGGVRVPIYHNSTAKMNAVGVVSNPGWTMINGVYTGCTDCHRVQNSRDGPFHAPGSVHYTSKESTCGIYNCHAPEEALNNPHYQIYLPFYCEALPCDIYGPSASPPQVSNLNLSPPVVNQSDIAVLTAKAWDNYNPIENAKYSIINGTGVVVDWTPMSPVDGRWGPNTRGENIQAEIDTAYLSPGVYTVQVKAMAGGPKTKPGRYYPDNGEWSTVKTVSLTVGEGII